MAILDQIRGPEDLRALPLFELPRLAQEMRELNIRVVGEGGGHLTSNLGVVELTIALHRVFDFRHDRLLFDVGHQCYPHKMLTGRQQRFHTIRKEGGLSGFPSTRESDFDLFDVGHAGTAIPTAVGLARADLLLKENRRIVSLVGDASIVNGVAFEGLNQAGTLKRQFLVVLNDNEWGISPTKGALANLLAKFRASNFYEEVKARAKQVLPSLPLVGKPTFDMLLHLKEGIKASVSPGQIFDDLNFQYIGPIDGHDIGHLIEMLHLVKDVQHPVLLHVHTQKGKGCDWAVKEPGKFHSPKPFVVSDGKVTLQSGKGKSWTRAFVDNLIELAENDSRIFAMTAGMPDGTGLNLFGERFPDRFLDVGISESCTVDMAAGMAKAGLRPVVAIYSTFLQRAFDQVFQEVVLQGHPVLFCMDRGGLVGGDGAVHHGFLDITYFRGFPNVVLMAPMDEVELRSAMELALGHHGPCAIRYPRDQAPAPMPDAPRFELGKSRTLREGDAATLLCYGVTCGPALAAAEALAKEGIEAAVVNARFAKPLDADMVRRACALGGPILTLEDHSTAGGFGSAVLETIHDLGLTPPRVLRLGMPENEFIPHASRGGQLKRVGLDAESIAQRVRDLLGLSPRERPREAVAPTATIRPTSIPC